MAVLTVGSGQEFSTLSAAVTASANGDVIQVQAGTYTNDFPQDITDNITIEGVGGMANFVATEQIPNGKAILVTDGNVTIDHLLFSGATVSDGNGAGIRYQSGNLVLTNDEFDNNQNGILGAASAGGTISISNSVFNHNGSGSGNTHGIYIGDIASLTVTNSLFENALVGHEIKSRAETNTITNSVIADGSSGTASYSIDLPDGGNDTITGNTIEKGPNSQNPILISYGEEGGIYANSQLTVSNNKLLDDQSSPSALGVRNTTSATATVTGNQIYGLNASNTLSGTGTAGGNTYPSTEPSYSTASPIQSSSGTGMGGGGGTGPGGGGSGPGGGGGTPPTGTLVLNVAEFAYQGDAQFTVSIDGSQVGGTYTATASQAAKQSQAITISTSLSPGPHQVGISFVNGDTGSSATTERRLYLDSATLNGNTISGSTASFPYLGSAEFNTATAGKTNTMLLVMSETAYQGHDAQFTVSVDGSQLAGTYSVTASSHLGHTEDFYFQGIPGAGSAHNVSISLINPTANGTANSEVKLIVNQVQFNQQTVSKGAVTLATSTPDTFTVPAAHF